MEEGRAGAALRARVVVDRGDFRLDVAVDAAAGEVVGVLGPNGAGKSTLLRALAGLTPLTAGRVVLGGEVLDDPSSGVFSPAARRPVALVFQDLRLFPHLDVLDNVAFARRSAGAPRRAARAHARGWLERLDLAALAGRRPAALSGGQAQRVALARALACEPGLLLLDEPLSALDVQVRQELRTALRGDLAHAAGPTLVVTHDPLEAMVLADRLLVVEGGVVVQTGAPADVARRPATGYVARLVGLNLYRGVRRTTGGAVELDGGGALVAAGEDRPGRLLVAVRPAAVTLHPEHPGAASARNVWDGVVAGLALLGDRVRVDVRGRPDVLVDLTPAAVAELGLRPGAHVWLSAKATDALAYAQG